MARRFTLNPEEDQTDYNYRPSQMSRRVKNNLTIEENDPRFTPQPLKPKIGFMPEEDEEEDPDPYGYGTALKRYNDELSGEQPALSKYREALQQTPQQQDYDLGRWGKVGAALAGFGAGYQDPVKGIAVAKSLREAPWQRALKQHEDQLKGLGTEAEFEQDDRKNRMAGVKLQLDTIDKRRDADREMKLANALMHRQDVQNETDIAGANTAAGRLRMDAHKSQADIDRDIDVNNINAAYRSGLIDIGQKNAQTNAANARANAMNAQTNRGNMGINQQNAATRSFEAGTGRFNAETGRKRFEFDSGPAFDETVQQHMFDRYMDEQEEAGRNQRDANNPASYIAPNAQTDAMSSAASDININLPQYRDYLSYDKKTGKVSIRQDLTPKQLADPKFAEFKAELTGRTKKIMNQTRGGNGSGRYQFESQ